MNAAYNQTAQSAFTRAIILLRIRLGRPNAIWDVLYVVNRTHSTALYQMQYIARSDFAIARWHISFARSKAYLHLAPINFDPTMRHRESHL